MTTGVETNKINYNCLPLLVNDNETEVKYEVTKK